MMAMILYLQAHTLKQNLVMGLFNLMYLCRTYKATSILTTVQDLLTKIRILVGDNCLLQLSPIFVCYIMQKLIKIY